MRLVYSFVFVVLAAGLCLATYFVAYQRFEEAAVKTSSERLSLYQSTLQSTLDRVAHLPRVVVLHPFMREVLRQGKSIVSFNGFLKSVNRKAGSAALYVLDREGTTIVASNYDNEESFVGNNYRFRRYYTDAMATGSGSYFAVGVTTNRPGYFLSEAIEDRGEPIGVAVVKVEFLELLESWREAGENVLISNEDGVIVLASNPRYLYKTLREISASRLEEIRAGRQFFGFELERLDYASGISGFAGNVTLENQDFVVTTTNIRNPKWNLHFLAPVEPVRNAAMTAGALVLLLCGIGAIGYLYARSRMERSKLEIAAVEAERVRAQAHRGAPAGNPGRVDPVQPSCGTGKNVGRDRS